MEWRLIIRQNRRQPASGVYSDWKDQIAGDCFFQCVYCTIHESQFGGTVNYHIDHFRPKSKFQDLINDIFNLFYACPICNRFKSSDWPCEPDLTLSSYPNPSDIDYATLFEIDEKYNLVGLYISSKYIINRLFLNRAQLIYERREIILRKKLSAIIAETKLLIDQVEQIDLGQAYESLRNMDTIKNNLLGLEEHRKKIRPYEVHEIRK